MIGFSFPPLPGGGGSTGDLQAVTDLGNVTTNSMAVKPTTNENKAVMTADDISGAIYATENVFNSIVGLRSNAVGATAGTDLYFYDALNGSILSVQANRPNILTNTTVVFDYDAGVIVIKHIGNVSIINNGTNTYSWPHGLPFNPSFVTVVNVNNTNATGNHYIKWNVTDIIVVFDTPPINSPLEWYWMAIK